MKYYLSGTKFRIIAICCNGCINEFFNTEFVHCVSIPETTSRNDDRVAWMRLRE